MPPEHDKPPFGPWLRQLREQAGTSRQQLADLTRIPWIRLGAIELARKEATDDEKARIVAELKKLGVPLAD